MTDFPSFGNANREAPPTQKNSYPNIQFAANINKVSDSLKTVVIAVSIVNLNVNLVVNTLERIFAYALDSANSELNSSTVALDSQNSLPTIHFEIDITKAASQGLTPPASPGGLATQTFTFYKIANIDILIENLQIALLASTLQRIKTYMVAAVSTDLNP
jgi:hypothetical protein